jgi:methionyl-tRNA synthetase
MDEFAFQRALAAIWEFIGVVNRYVDTTQPWSLARNPAERPRLDRVLLTLAESVGYLGTVLEPFLPAAAARIRAALGATGAPRLADAELGRLDRLPPVQKLSGLFPRTDTEKSKAVPAGAAPTSSNRPPADQAGPAALVTIEDFGKIELRVAEVLAAEAVPGRRSCSSSRSRSAASSARWWRGSPSTTRRPTWWARRWSWSQIW